MTRTLLGQHSEELAARYLGRVGYRIVQRNYRCLGGEIDIVAWDGEVLCFVEVRSISNPAHGDPLETITPLKIRRLVRAAWDYLENWQGAWPPTRFDALGIVLTEKPDMYLVKEAFEASW